MKAQIIIIATILALVSCKKDKQELPILSNEGPQPQFNTPTTTGSYWVYQWFKIDSNGVETPIQDIDTVKVFGDTTINNLEYIIYKGNVGIGPTNPNSTQYTSYKRDSSGYVVSLNRGIEYSYVNFSDTLHKGSFPQLWDYYLKMFDNIQVTVPVGTFNSIENREYCYYASGDPVNTCGDAYFTRGRWYVEGIGKVKETNGFITEFKNCEYREARLIDYYIAP